MSPRAEPPSMPLAPARSAEPYIKEKDRWRYRVVVVGGSAGSFPVASRLLELLPKLYRLPLIICLHRLKEKREGFKEALEIKSAVPVREAEDKDRIQPSIAYVAPANYHLLVDPEEHFSLATTEMVQFSRPSIDVLFESVADVYGQSAVAILLSGANRDGASGLLRIRQRGGLTLVQQPAEAAIATMPEAALQLNAAEFVLPSEGLFRTLAALH